MQDSSTVIIIPTYNELENLELAVQRVHEHLPTAAVLVVDDESPDGTGRLADRLAADDRRVKVLHRTARGGLGGAYLAGFAWALDRGFEFVGEFDADGSHPADTLPAMYRAIATDPQVGLVIGSRWMAGGAVLDWPRSREILSRGGNLYARVMLGLGIRDATAGFRLYRASLLRSIDLDSVSSKGYCFQVELTVRAITAKSKVVEVPIVFRERQRGVSKMSRSIVLEAMAMVTLWGFARVLGRPGRWLAARAGMPVVTIQPRAAGA